MYENYQVSRTSGSTLKFGYPSESVRTMHQLKNIIIYYYNNVFYFLICATTKIYFEVDDGGRRNDVHNTCNGDTRLKVEALVLEAPTPPLPAFTATPSPNLCDFHEFPSTSTPRCAHIARQKLL